MVVKLDVLPVVPAAAHVLSFQTVQVSSRWGTDEALRDVVAAVADAGFRHIGLDHWSVESFLAAGGTLDAIADLLTASSLTCTDLCALVIGPVREDNLVQAHRFAALARCTGARLCATAVSDAVADPHAASVTESLSECADVLDDAGVRLALEYLPYLPVRDVVAAASICESVGWARIGLLVDSWATLVGDQLEAVGRLDGTQIALVQFADGHAPAPGQDLTDAGRNHRTLPGEGRLDLEGFVRAIRASGYDGPIGAEVLSSAQRARPVVDFARDLFQTSCRSWPHSS